MKDRWRESAGRVRIGVISDTHGTVKGDVLRVFEGVDHIIHAGDVGRPEVLDELAAVAPVTAVAGNVDGGWTGVDLPEEAAGRVGDVRFLVGHRKERLLDRHRDPAREGFDLVVSGHTHDAFADWVDGVLYLDPGTASAARGGGCTVAVVEVDLAGLDPRIVALNGDEDASSDGLGSEG